MNWSIRFAAASGRSQSPSPQLDLHRLPQLPLRNQPCVQICLQPPELHPKLLLVNAPPVSTLDTERGAVWTGSGVLWIGGR
jgi:hypothetical protein